MIYTSLNRIKENILNRDWLYWRMYQKDEKSLIAEAVNFEGITPKRSAEYLTEEIEALEGAGYVIVKLYQRPPKQGGDNSGNLTFYVKISGTEVDEPIKGASGYQNPNISLISGFHNQITDLKLELIKKDNENAIKELQAKYDAKNSSTSVDPILKEILGIAKTVLAPKIINPSASAAPVQNEVRPINGIEEKKEFTELIKKWHSLDTHYIDAMKAIVYFAEKDYNSYRQNIDLLINAYKNK